MMTDSLWEMCRRDYETEEWVLDELAETYGVTSGDLYRKLKKDKWKRNIVMKEAIHNKSIMDSINKKRLDMRYTREYVDLIGEKMRYLDERQYIEEVNHFKNANILGVLADHMGKFLESHDVLNNNMIDGINKPDMAIFIKLIAAAKNLIVEDKTPQTAVAVQVNSQVSIMDDIAKQHKSIYDDVKYDK